LFRAVHLVIAGVIDHQVQVAAINGKIIVDVGGQRAVDRRYSGYGIRLRFVKIGAGKAAQRLLHQLVAGALGNGYGYYRRYKSIWLY